MSDDKKQDNNQQQQQQQGGNDRKQGGNDRRQGGNDRRQGGRQGGRPGGRKPFGKKRRGPRKEKEWIPVTKLGRLVKENQIKTLEDIYKFAVPIKEYQIVDHFCGRDKLKDEVMKISPVQKATRAGQRTRFKAIVCIGDENGHCGLGIKCAAEVATAIRGALILAKLSLIPVRRGYWGSTLGKPHTVPFKVTGKCGSVSVRLVPAPRGTGIVAAPVPKKLLQFAGVEDIFTTSTGHTKTLGNFIKATFAAVAQTYCFLTPDLWKENDYSQLPPFEHYSDYLSSEKPTKSFGRRSYHNNKR